MQSNIFKIPVFILRKCFKIGRNYLAFVIIVPIILVTLYYCHLRFNILAQNYLSLFRNSLVLSNESREILSTNSFNHRNSWKPMMTIEPHFQLYSAFFDPRLDIVGKWSNNLPDTLPIGSVRVISIMRMNVDNRNVYCHFKYARGMIRVVRAYEVYPMDEHWNKKYTSFFIVCPLVQDVRYREINLPENVGVSLSDNFDLLESFIQISYSRDHKQILDNDLVDDKLAICVAPAHSSYSNVLRVIEFIEFYKLLGASMFYLYNKSISTDVRNTFELYKKDQVAQIFQWNLDGYDSDVDLHYHGIMAALNDCLYRATFVDGFKYVAIVDFDELLMPLKDDTKILPDLLSKHDTDSTHSFCFQNVFFFEHLEANFSNVPKDAVNQFLYTQAQIRRTEKPSGKRHRSKCIVKGHLITEVGNHFVWKSIRNSVEYSIETDEGLLFHYRDDCVPSEDFCNKPIIVDDRARKYGNALWKSVDRVCNKLFYNGKCPLQYDDVS